MTTLFKTRNDKEKALNNFEEALKLFVLNGISPSNQGLVLSHLESMKSNPNPLNTTCKLETFPETQITRITIDYSFAPSIKPFQ